MAGRDKKARRLRSLRALFEDAGGGRRSSGRLPIQALLGAALRAAAGLSGLTRCKSVFCRSQPTGGSCVGNEGETQLKRALTQGAGIVSNLSRSKRGSALACSRCGAAMDEVVRIEPLAGEPGLIAYECPSCGYVTSLFSHPDGGH